MMYQIYKDTFDLPFDKKMELNEEELFDLYFYQRPGAELVREFEFYNDAVKFMEDEELQPARWIKDADGGYLLAGEICYLQEVEDIASKEAEVNGLKGNLYQYMITLFKVDMDSIDQKEPNPALELFGM